MNCPDTQDVVKAEPFQCLGLASPLHKIWSLWFFLFTPSICSLLWSFQNCLQEGISLFEFNFLKVIFFNFLIFSFNKKLKNNLRK